MKFKVGKKYLTREGRVAEYLGRDGGDGDTRWPHIFRIEGYGPITTTDSGRYQDSSAIHNRDIVSAFKPTESSAPPTLDRNESVPYAPSRRDYFAAAALQGAMAFPVGSTPNEHARFVIQCADALIKALDEETGK